MNRSLLKRAVLSLSFPLLLTLPPSAEPLAQTGHATKLQSLSAACREPVIRIFAVGHIYGDPRKWPNPRLASSLLRALPQMRSAPPTFVMVLGDLLAHPSSGAYEALRTAFVEPLGVPVFNAPGNHDLIDHRLYERHWGPTRYSFVCGNTGILVVNSETAESGLAEEIEHATRFIEAVAGDETLENLFVFSHKLIWAGPGSDLAIAGRKSNWWGTTPLFAALLPALRAAGRTKRVFWGSGDLGSRRGFSTFMSRVRDDNVGYFAAGLGDLSSDALVEIVIRRGRAPEFHKRPLVPGLGAREDLEGVSTYYIRSVFERLRSALDLSGAGK